MQKFANIAMLLKMPNGFLANICMTETEAFRYNISSGNTSTLSKCALLFNKWFTLEWNHRIK